MAGGAGEWLPDPVNEATAGNGIYVTNISCRARVLSNNARHLMFVNRTDKTLQLVVLPTQEEPFRDRWSVKLTAGNVGVGASTQQTIGDRRGAWRPQTIVLNPTSDTAAELPPFEVPRVWKRTDGSVHYLVGTLDGDYLLCWKQGYATGGRQYHFQQPMFSSGKPMGKTMYRFKDGEEIREDVVSALLSFLHD